MNMHEYSINIPAKTEAEAIEKMKAFTILASKLTGKELAKLAHTVQHDPVKTAMAKVYLGV
jgi:ribosomal protein L25 (general stress protein Ctc)